MINYTETGNKSYLLLALLELLKNHTDSEHPLEKKEIRDLMKREYGIPMSRNTLDEKFRALEDAGYEIFRTEKGWYLDDDGITDGELRILIDSILYSDMLNQTYSKNLIEKLSELGSVSFKEYVKTLKYRAENISKTKSYNTVNIIEAVQRAIFKNRQISCNSITYRDELIPRHVYDEDIIVSPYELAFSGGRYYLLCAKNGEEKLTALRVDRLDRVKILDTPSHEADELKRIKKNSSIAEYIDKQPDLCGGRLEMFTIACHRDALDDMYDAFGNRARIFTSFDENYNDPDVVMLHVDTTRESIKYWAITHSDKIVVVSPQEVRDEIAQAIENSQHEYFKAGKNPRTRMMRAISLDEAIKEMKLAKKKFLFYHGRSKKDKYETIDTFLFEKCPEVTYLKLFRCKIEDTKMLQYFPNLRSLSLNGCDFDYSLLENHLNLENIDISECDETALSYISRMSTLKRICIYNSEMTNLDFLADCKDLISVRLIRCKQLTDLSVLEKLQNLKCIDIGRCDEIRDFSCLKNLPELKRVYIENRNFTDENISELKHLLPDCRIDVT